IRWTVGDVVNYVDAHVDDTTIGSGDVSYSYGVDDPVQGLTPAGDTSGRLFEGPKGVVQIDLPASVATGTLDDPWAVAAEAIPGFVLYGDSAPDGQTGGAA